MPLTARHPPQLEPLTLRLGADHREMKFTAWPAAWEERSRLLWATLHRRALLAKENDRVWLTAFAGQLPCGECRSHFWQLVLERPPVWGDEFFGWTVRLHNTINSKLGKSLRSEADARAYWSLVKT